MANSLGNIVSSTLAEDKAKSESMADLKLRYRNLLALVDKLALYSY